MKKLFTIALMNLLCMAGMAQVTYFGTNNYFLNYFTDTGFSKYDWHYEPLKTDLQRGGLKGKVVKVVSNIRDIWSRRGYGISFTDTTYYNAQGNISKVIAPKKDDLDRFEFQPDIWEYEYDSNGVLDGYVYLSEIVRNGEKVLEKHVHTMEKNAVGRITKEVYRSYSQEKDGSWKEFAADFGDPEWVFTYDENGSLISGIGCSSLSIDLTYENGQISKMYIADVKPVSYTYDAEGRLVEFSNFFIEGMDEDVYNEENVVISYNENGDIGMTTKAHYVCNSQWKRRAYYYKDVYAFSYTYDSHGNWTDALVTIEATDNEPQSEVFTISREITYDDNDDTGIKGVKSESMKSDKWYNLSGQRVDALKKGIYIRNGRKIVIRQYDIW